MPARFEATRALDDDMADSFRELATLPSFSLVW